MSTMATKDGTEIYFNDCGSAPERAMNPHAKGRRMASLETPTDLNPNGVRDIPGALTIRPLFNADSGVFGPEDIKPIVAAFEDTLRAMRLVDRSDPVVTLVAKVVIEIAKQGERDPIRLREKVVQRLNDVEVP